MMTVMNYVSGRYMTVNIGKEYLIWKQCQKIIGFQENT